MSTRRIVLGGTVALATFALALASGTTSPEATAFAAVLAWSAALSLILWEAPRVRAAPPPALIGLAALVGLAGLSAISIGWAPDDGRAFEDAVRISLYAAVLVITVAAVRRGDGRAVLVGLAAGLLAVSLLALGSRLLPDLLTGDQTRMERFAESRLGYPIGYWNGLAACVAMAIPLWVWLSATAPTQATRAAAAGALPPLVLTLYLTGSRGGLLAAAAGLAVLATLAPMRQRLLAGLGIGLVAGFLLALVASFSDPLVDGTGDAAHRRAGLLLLGLTVAGGLAAAFLRRAADRRIALPGISRGVGVAALALTVVVTAVLVISDRGGGDGEPVRGSDPVAESSSGLARLGTTWRGDLWASALDAFASAPLHGVGAAGFQTWWNRNATEPVVNRHAHSLYLGRLAELGLLGFLLLAAFVVVAVREAARRTYGDLDGSVAAAAAVAAVGLCTGIYEWTFSIPAAFVPLVISVALLTGPATARVPRRRRRRREVRFLTGALAALALVAMAAAGSLYLSERALNASRDAAAEEDWALAASRASRAASLQPFSVTPLLQLAQVQGLAFDLEGARRTLEDAEELAPEDPRVALLKARILYFLEDPEWRREVERFEQLSP